MKHEDVTIVIPTLYTELSARGLYICLDSLSETFNGPIVVAFNGGEQVDLQNKYNNVHVEIIRKQGQCYATNRAMRWVETPWVMVSNDDMVYPPGWFEKFTDTVENFGLLMASPNLVEPQTGAPPFIEKYCGGLGTIGTDINFDKECFINFAEEYKEHENRPVEHIVEDGFNLPFLIRKDVWDTIGGYDEEYDPWGSNSDSDLQYKAILSGVTPKRIRSTLVYHFSNTSGTFHPEKRSYWEENRRYFEKKWGFERASSPEIWYKLEIPKEINYNPDWRGKYEVQD